MIETGRVNVNRIRGELVTVLMVRARRMTIKPSDVALVGSLLFFPSILGVLNCFLSTFLLSTFLLCRRLLAN